MKGNRNVIYILTFFIITLNLFGENHIWFKKDLNTENYNIMLTQDKQGILWFASSGGIMKYNGYEKEFITAGEKGLSSNLVPSIFVDSQGLMWIATWNGLNQYNKETKKFKYFFHDEDKKSISSNEYNWAPKLIAEDNDGEIWIGTKYGLNKYNKEKETIKIFYANNDENSLSGNNIWTVMADTNNNIWIGTQNNGLSRYNKKTGMFTRYKYDPDKPNETIGKGIVYAIIEDNDGYIWIGTSEGGLTKLDPETSVIKKYRYNPDNKMGIASNEVFSLMQDSTGKIWITRNYSTSLGIEIFDPKTEKFTLYSKEDNLGLSGNNYMSVFEDNSGTIWLPNNLGEVDKYDKKTPRFISTKDITADPENDISILSLAQNDSIWMGTATNGLVKFDNKEFTYYKPEKNNPRSVSSNYIFSVLPSGENHIWFSTNDGKISLFNIKKEIVEKSYQNPILKTTARGMIRDKFNPNVFWFGTEGHGFFKFNKKTGDFKQYKNDIDDPRSLSHNLIQNLFQDKKGNIWIPTHGGGLNKFNRDTEDFINFKKDESDPNSITGNMVFDCLIDKKGRFWITTDDGGLNQFFPKKGKFKSYGKKAGFTTKSLKALVEDDLGYVWITSNSGLYKFDPDKKEVINVYMKEDGLTGDQFSFFVTGSKKLEDGTIIVNTAHGINRFNPKNLEKNMYNPPIIISSLKQGGKKLDLNRAYEIVD
ncbi:MAG: ligand-binding sensor domain-containing protein, partial [Fusobacteriota bacterium]